jgi:hypothetical protein
MKHSPLCIHPRCFHLHFHLTQEPAKLVFNVFYFIKVNAKRRENIDEEATTKVMLVEDVIYVHTSFLSNNRYNKSLGSL